jgi:NAD(P)-dependent dehydrogenase (short-subunit alcohol dehydrogenase family)
MGRLDGKVAIITGASSGIGRATAEAFAREGARVVVTSRRQDKLDALIEQIESSGGTASPVVADLEDSGAGAAIVQGALDAYGQVDILVSNAGVGWQYGIDNPGTMAGIHEANLDNWRAIIGGVDLEGYYLMVHAALPHMLERGQGAIVLVSSMAGLTGLYDAHAYTAAKGAILNLSRSMAITYIKQGVRTNAVCPGFIDTPMIAPVIGAFDDPAVAATLSPIARPGRPDEIANAILFLASDEASYCNGATLVVDGGSTARSFAG